MKKFRRLCAMFAALVVMLGLLVTPASAEEVTEGENTPVVDTEQGGEVITLPEEREPVEEPTEIVNDTFVARVWEFVDANLGEIVSTISAIVTGGFLFYQKSKNGTLIQGISRVLKSQGGVEHASGEVTNALKVVEEKQELLNKFIDEYSKSEAERSKVTAALLVEVMGLIEIQHIQTLNNANVPQAYKDLVTSKYARCLSTINDDEELKAIYDEIREKLGLGGNPDDEVWDD